MNFRFSVIFIPSDRLRKSTNYQGIEMTNVVQMKYIIVLSEIDCVRLYNEDVW